MNESVRTSVLKLGMALLTLAVFWGPASTAWAQAPSHKAPETKRGNAATKPQQAPPAGTEIDGIVAVVNNQPILQSRLTEAMNRYRAQLQSQGTALPPQPVFRRQVIQHLVTQSLELQSANNHGIQVTDDQVDSVLSRIASQHNMSLAQLPQALSAQGRSYSEFRQQIRDQLIIHRLEQQAVASNIEVSPAEIQQYLSENQNKQTSQNQYHLAQILIAFPNNPSPAQAKAAKKKAEQVYEKLKHGADFASTAVAVSGGPHALKGGNLGWIKGSEMPTLFTKLVDQLSPGQISKPVAGPSGYHIVKLIAVKKNQKKKIITEYHVRHIMLRPNPVRNLKQTHKLAEKIRHEIVSGKVSFADAAQQYSDDPNSSGNGGDLGWLQADQLPPTMAHTVETIKTNTVSQPIKTQYGWHIVEVLGKRKRDETQAMKKNQAYQAIYQRKLTEQLASFRQHLRDNAYIKIFKQSKQGG